MACGEHTSGTQFCQRASVFGPPLPGRLHFDADPVLAAAPYEVHFHARGSAVVGQLTAAARIRDPRAQFMEDQRLQQKVIKRMAYGFRDDAYFFLKIRAAFPGVR